MNMLDLFELRIKRTPSLIDTFSDVSHTETNNIFLYLYQRHNWSVVLFVNFRIFFFPRNAFFSSCAKTNNSRRHRNLY